jgi:hypothetical protein
MPPKNYRFHSRVKLKSGISEAEASKVMNWGWTLNKGNANFRQSETVEWDPEASTWEVWIWDGPEEMSE